MRKVLILTLIVWVGFMSLSYKDKWSNIKPVKADSQTLTLNNAMVMEISSPMPAVLQNDASASYQVIFLKVKDSGYIFVMNLTDNPEALFLKPGDLITCDAHTEGLKNSIKKTNYASPYNYMYYIGDFKKIPFDPATVAE